MRGQLNIEAVRGEGFSLEPALRDGRIELSFSGNGDMDAAPSIGPFLKLLHDEVLAHGGGDVFVDLRELRFMNSSCLKAFVWWIDRVRSLGDDGYRIRIRPDPESHWQRRSLDTLQRTAPEHVVIETTGQEWP